MDLVKHIHFVNNKRKENSKFFKKLKNIKPKVLDKTIISVHETVFKALIVWNVPIVVKLQVHHLQIKTFKEYQIF